MNKSVLLQLITSGTGSLGFCLVFRVKMKNIPAGAVGGILCWGIYLLFEKHTTDILIASLAAAAFSTFYAEAAARILKAPATVFLIPTLIPLVPGGSLYYTMYYGVMKRWLRSEYYGSRTLRYALGIAAGVSLVLTANEIYYRYKTKIKTQE